MKRFWVYEIDKGEESGRWVEAPRLGLANEAYSKAVKGRIGSSGTRASHYSPFCPMVDPAWDAEEGEVSDEAQDAPAGDGGGALVPDAPSCYDAAG